VDLLCPKCGEPWDNDELHYVEVEELNDCLSSHNLPTVEEASYKDASKLFRMFGCEVFGCSHSTPDSDAAMLASMTYDLMGDDMDGAASMFDDAEYLGIL
jgi:hypothetical protein